MLAQLLQDIHHSSRKLWFYGSLWNDTRRDKETLPIRYAD